MSLGIQPRFFDVIKLERKVLWGVSGGVTRNSALTLSISIRVFLTFITLVTRSFVISDKSAIADSCVPIILNNFPITIFADGVFGSFRFIFLQMILRVSPVDSFADPYHLVYTGPNVEFTIDSSPISWYWARSGSKSKKMNQLRRKGFFALLLIHHSH